jgi:hypothetical protein
VSGVEVLKNQYLPESEPGSRVDGPRPPSGVDLTESGNNDAKVEIVAQNAKRLSSRMELQLINLRLLSSQLPSAQDT